MPPSYSRQSSRKCNCLIAACLYTGSLCPEIKFSVDQNEEPGCSCPVHQNSEPEWSRAVEQILTLFIFIQYTDAFHSQVSDFISRSHVLVLSNSELKIGLDILRFCSEC